MRTPWSTIPMLRIWLAAVAGVLCYITLNCFGCTAPFTACLVLVLVVTGLLFLLATNFLSLQQQFKLQSAQGFATSIILAGLGYLLAWNYNDKNDTRFFEHHLNSGTSAIVLISEPPVQKDKTINAIVTVKELSGDTVWANLQGKVAVNFIKDSNALALQYGDVLLINTKIETFGEPANPAEFNYKKYQANRNVYYRAFVNEGNWKLLRRDDGNFFFAAVYQLRGKFLNVIAQYIKDENDFGVATAIMLGYRDYVNADLMQAYSSSGVLHVLSVSGLHVGIMFMMLNFLLGWLDKKGRKYAIGKAVFIIGFIWVYACLTGLCPSVLRSALMFSMLQAGLAFRRDASIYNILASTALLLMLFNPFIITDVGFQLSYLAVAGIVFLQPRIYTLLAFKNKLLDWGWKLTSVSIAAQLATFPVSIYYFHQFPNLFLFSNLAVIPLSNFILISGTALFLVSWVPGLNALTGFCFKWLLWLMNRFVFWVDTLPFAQTKGLSISAFEMLLLYAVILLCCWLLVERRSKVAVLSVTLCFVLCCSFALDRVQAVNQKELIVYCVKGKKAIGFMNGRTLIRDFDESLLTDEKTLQYRIRPYLWQRGIRQTVALDSVVGLPFGKLVEFEGKRIFIIDKELRYTNVGKHLKADICIVTHSPRIYMDKLKAAIDCSLIVFDSSNNKRQVAYWKKECAKLSQPCYDVAESGAYVLKF